MLGKYPTLSHMLSYNKNSLSEMFILYLLIYSMKNGKKK